MNEQSQQILPAQNKLNSAPIGFAAVIRQVVAEAIEPQMPRPAPVTKSGSVDPPKKPEPGGDTAFPAPQKTQMEDSTQRLIDLGGNGKQLPAGKGTAQYAGQKKSVWPPLPPELIDAIADAAIEALPGIQQKLLTGGVIAAPIVPGREQMVIPEEATIPCRIELRLRLSTEGKAAAPSFFHFDRSDTFCRLAIINLNVENPATRSALEKHNVGAIRFFAGVSFAKCLLRDPRSALVETLLTEIKTKADIAPNQQLGTAAFARRLAESPLLGGIERLPIFGPACADAVGRSFPLTELDLAIPVAGLGEPWDRTPLRTKGTKS